MKGVEEWVDRCSDNNSNSNSSGNGGNGGNGQGRPAIYDIAFSPDGTQMIAAVGAKVYVYDTGEGELIQALKGHKDTVYCVTYSRDGKRFASGSADKWVVIWNNKREGILKYSHQEAIQCMAYNPITAQLASCTAIDFGLWSPEQKSVAKHKVAAKVLCCSWTNDGQFLALGMVNGHVSIRDKSGDERVRIERSAPIWTLAWNPSKDEPYDILAVGDWDQKLAFYQLSGRPMGRDRDLGFDPCCISYFSNGEYILIGGSDHKCSIWTKEGVFLMTVAERDEWIWTCKAKPKDNFMALGTNEGVVAMYKLSFSVVHGLYQDRYAYRDYMTDVVVQHLTLEKKVKIKCRDLVQKISVYRDRLAVQLSDRIMIYQVNNSSAENPDMNYSPKEKILKKLDCSLLVVTSSHIVLCLLSTLQLLDFRGNLIREWNLDDYIRYIKVIGGPAENEGLIVGLGNGQIVKIFLQNQFPIHLVKHSSNICCIDINCSRQKLAVTDNSAICFVYNISNQELLFREPNAKSVAWNLHFEDMLCFSANGILSIKTGTFPVHSQKFNGFVVGFKGSKIFCLQGYSILTVDVPQSASVYRYIEKKDFTNAYKVACLGATDSDWQVLAHEALLSFSLEVARKSFVRLKDMHYSELVNRIGKLRNLSLKSNGNNASLREKDDAAFMAEILCYEGRYQEAAKLLAKHGMADKAVDIFSDLRQYEQAKLYARTVEGVNVQTLLKKQADWTEGTGDSKAAIEMYVAAGEYEQAVDLISQKGLVETELFETVRNMPKTETAALNAAANIFKRNNKLEQAREIYEKLGDIPALIKLFVNSNMWTDAINLVKQKPEMIEDVYVPYAHWLAVNDQFEESEEAFLKAGKPTEALKVLEHLTHNAVVECQFNDAAYYFYKLSLHALKEVKSTNSKNMTKEEQRQISRYYDFQNKADLYYAYNFIHKYSEEPFVNISAEAIFQISRFLLAKCNNSNHSSNRNTNNNLKLPLGISRVRILHALAKKSTELGNYKLARAAYEKLLTLYLPPAMAEEVEVNMIKLRAMPFSDKEEYSPICSRCTSLNPLTINGNDCCTTCDAEFQRSFYSFELLPLVEFKLEDGISDEEARKFIENETSLNHANGDNNNNNNKTRQIDLFTKLLTETLDTSEPLKVNRKILENARRDEVFIKKGPNPVIPCRYYKSIVPSSDIGILLVDTCNRFFLQEDYDFATLQSKSWPFITNKTQNTTDSSF